MNTVISTTNAPGAIGPYSQGYIAGDMIFLSGQLGVDPSTEQLGKDIKEQAELSCQNVKALLEAAGTDFSAVVKTTCFLADMNDFAVFNEIYAKYFSSLPARSCVAVKALPKGGLCEIEVIARK